MNSSLTILSLTLIGLLTLAGGCGKTDNPAPVSTTEVKTIPADKPKPATVEMPSTQISNAVVAAPVALKTDADSPVKTVDSIVSTPAKTPPQAVVTPNPVAAANLAQGLGQTTTGLAGLSQDQMVQGLEAALGKGLQQAIARLGHEGGFLTNLSVKIPMPEKLQKIETALRAIKQDKLADDFVVTMNHAAEQAVPEAGSVFADALKHLTFEDAKSILNGPNDAATQYFQKTTQTNLYTRFYPIIQKATAKTGVTAAYKNLLEKADVTKSLGSIGSALSGALLDKDSLDVDAYVTNKAMDGLFKMVAEEEKQIRQNPIARTSDLLQKVFGALKR